MRPPTSCQIGLHVITSSIHGKSGAAVEPAGLASRVKRAWGEVSFTARKAGPSMRISPILSRRTARMFFASSHPFIPRSLSGCLLVVRLERENRYNYLYTPLATAGSPPLPPSPASPTAGTHAHRDRYGYSRCDTKHPGTTGDEARA